MSYRIVTGLCVALALGTIGGCDSSTLGPAAEDVLSQRIESPTHSYLFSMADAVDTASHEAHFRWLKGALGIDLATKLQFHKYRDRAHLQRMTGRATNGFAEPGTPRFHTIWPWDNHEGVHAVVILTLGHPPALFNEGVAVAHQTNPRVGPRRLRSHGGRRVGAVASLSSRRCIKNLGREVIAGASGRATRADERAGERLTLRLLSPMSRSGAEITGRDRVRLREHVIA